MNIKLSACTIAKNEALNIGKSIDSYKEYVDEIIIVDTGSTDETIDIAKGKGAKVFNFEWKNDFSAAKNFALDNATGDWIIFLDADEWFDSDTAKNIRTAIENAIRLNYNAVACKMVNFYTETEIAETASSMRIFKHSDNIRYNRTIHEALFDIDKNIALPSIFTELLTINHSGYMKGLLLKKAKRNKLLLDRNFALGNFTPIDYFYGLRENLKENLEVSDYFFRLIENTPNYDELVSSFNVTTSIDENRVKVANLFPNKYSFEYRVKMLEDIQKKHVNNPTFKFYEYLLFEKIDKKRAIKALEDAVEFEKKFEKDNMISSNPFYAKKSEAYALLGEHYVFLNDKLKALDCFTQALKVDCMNFKALMGLLHIISNEKTEDVVMFINSIIDVSKKENEKFIVDALRLTEFKEIFLYYFVDYYKKYEEVDKAFFTSRLLTENFEETADKYVKVYKESKDERAFLLISAALVAGNCKDKFFSISENMSYTYLTVLYAYFNNQPMENFSENDFQIAFGIFKEIAYIADIDTIDRFVSICGVAKEKFYFEISKYYYLQASYSYVLNWIDRIKQKNDITDNLLTYFNYLLTNIYFRNNEFDKIPECLDKVILNGLLEQDIVLICEILEADDDKLQEYFELFDSLNFAKINMPLDKIDDILYDAVKFMSIDKLQEELKDKKISVVEDHLKIFFDFAEKLKKQRAFSLAEKYYKISLKYNYRVDRCYLALGEIYNYFDKPDLSFYCYQNAFIENFTLAGEILPNGHSNKNYIFSKKAEKIIDRCPICGGTSKPTATYMNIEDENLTYNEPAIVKYSCCDECGHVFAENDIEEKIYWSKFDNNIDESKISAAYDILENICDITEGDSILDCSDDNGEFKTAAESYGFRVEKPDLSKTADIIFMEDLLSKTYKVEETIRKYSDNLPSDGVIVFQIYDADNAFSKLADKPMWAKAGIKNIFSKKSIDVLFNKLGLQILQINVDKINKGKIIVFAGK